MTGSGAGVRGAAARGLSALWTAVSGIAALAALVELAVIAWLVSDPFDSWAGFDAQLWARASRDFGCERGPMVRDLQAKLLRPGTPLAAVEQALGRPDGQARSLLEYRYSLGQCGGRRPDPPSLAVLFNEAGEYQMSDLVDPAPAR